MQLTHFNLIVKCYQLGFRYMTRCLPMCKVVVTIDLQQLLCSFNPDQWMALLFYAVMFVFVQMTERTEVQRMTRLHRSSR